ncbi:hypothetical protein [Deferrisoma palaeochoriense]
MGEPNSAPPRVSPYVFPVLLAAFGLWCLWDGWITTNPEMLDHQTFNRIASALLLPWAAYDFFRVRRRAREKEGSGGG